MVVVIPIRRRVMLQNAFVAQPSRTCALWRHMRMFMRRRNGAGACAAPRLLHAMRLHGARACVGLWVHARHVHAQTIAVQLLAAMLAASHFEFALAAIWVEQAMMTLVFQHPALSKASAAELALGILRRRCSHFLVSRDSGVALRHVHGLAPPARYGHAVAGGCPALQRASRGRPSASPALRINGGAPS